MDDTQRAQVLAGAGYLTGVAGALAPGLVAKTFGIREVGGDLESVVRMMSLRNLALAAAMTAVADDERLRKRFFTIAAAMFAADTVAGVVSVARGKSSLRSFATLAPLTGGLAAVAFGGANG